jgi:hypothetical protein
LGEATAFTGDLVELGTDSALATGVMPAKTGTSIPILAVWAISETVNALASFVVPVFWRGGSNDSVIAESLIGANAVIRRRVSKAPCVCKSIKTIGEFDANTKVYIPSLVSRASLGGNDAETQA